MSAYPIVYLGDPVLRSACDPVTSFDAALGRLVDDMFDAMYAARGVGLAANQVGVGLRVFVYDCDEDGGHGQVGHVVNPRLVETGGEIVEAEEGCLSLPGLYFPTPRAEHAVVEGFDRAGRPIRVEGKGYVARCLQHEAGHLEGRVYTDVLTGETRRAALRAIREATWSAR
jgi:peptide deformylase